MKLTESDTKKMMESLPWIDPCVNPFQLKLLLAEPAATHRPSTGSWSWDHLVKLYTDFALLSSTLFVQLGVVSPLESINTLQVGATSKSK